MDAKEVRVVAVSIVPTAVGSTDILRLPAGDIETPDKAMVTKLLALAVLAVAATTFVPSHNLAYSEPLLTLCETVTVPLTNHVPEDPCDTTGPSKKVEVLFSEIFAVVALVMKPSTPVVVDVDMLMSAGVGN